MQQTASPSLLTHFYIALAYALLGYLGLLLSIPPGFSSILWPASGIALGATLIYGYSAAFGVFVGSLCVNIWSQSQSGTPDLQFQHFLPTIGIACGAAIQSLAGAFLIKRLMTDPGDFLSLKQIIRFQSLAAASCVFNTTIGNLSLYLGAILPSENFGINWLTWLMGDVLGCMIFAPITLLLFGRSEQHKNSEGNPKLTLALPLLVCFFVAFGMFKFAIQKEIHQQQQLFQSQAQNLANRVNDQLTQYHAAFNSLYFFFTASEFVTADEFQQFSRSLLYANAGLRAFGWNQLIQEWQRNDYESAMRSRLGQDFNITEKSPDGDLIPANQRPYYVVVTYIEPYEGNEKALGYDINSDEDRRRGLENATHSGEATTTLIELVQNKGTRTGLLSFRPYFTNDTKESLQGYVTSVIELKQFFRNVVSHINSDHLQLQMFDHQPDGSQRLLYELQSPGVQGMTPEKLHAHNLILKAPFTVADKQWQMVITPMTPFSHASWGSYFSLTSIFLFTALLVIFLQTQSGRSRQIHALVAIRTQDLQKTNLQLQDEISTRKRLQQEQSLRNEVLVMLSDSRQLRDIMEVIALRVEQQHPLMICSILILDKDGKHLKLCSAPGLPEAYNQAIDGLVIGAEEGSCGSAAYTGKTVIVDDISTHPLWQNYRELAAQAGLAACWSIPILSSQHQVLGTFAIYYREIRKPEQGELEYIHNLAQLACLAIERKSADEDLRIAATTFELHESIIITDAAGTILRVNHAFTEVTGYEESEAIGNNPSMFASGKHDRQFYKDLFAQLGDTGQWQGEIWNKRKNGEIYPEEITITAVKNEQGLTSHYVGLFSDITERKEYEERIQNLAYFDPLTKLPNRRMMLNKLKQEIAHTKRQHVFGAVLFIDLDHFKTLNDSLGHHFGDELLQQVGQRLSDGLREEDTAARIGGDEFVVLLHAQNESLDLAAKQALQVAEKLRNLISSPYELQGIELNFSPSIGLTVYPQGHDDPLEILKQADAAMYSSKQKGRDQISFYHPDMQANANERLALENDLRQVLRNNGFELYYQPQLTIDNNVIGVEALIRWKDPKRGWVTPQEFIPIAEDSGLIIDIGKWVLKTACEQMKRWQQTGPAPDHIAVNVSSREFHTADFENRVINTIHQAGIKPEHIVLELTESILIENMQQTLDKMHTLKQAGIRISLDDFGTGYSSLTYLNTLPLYQIKIDQSFLHNLEFDNSNSTIIELIIEIARQMNLEVIAEGVETETQKEVLKQKKCNIYQGFYYSRPMPANEITGYIQEQSENPPESQ